MVDKVHVVIRREDEFPGKFKVWVFKDPREANNYANENSEWMAMRDTPIPLEEAYPEDGSMNGWMTSAGVPGSDKSYEDVRSIQIIFNVEVK